MLGSQEVRELLPRSPLPPPWFAINCGACRVMWFSEHFPVHILCHLNLLCDKARTLCNQQEIQVSRETCSSESDSNIALGRKGLGTPDLRLCRPPVSLGWHHQGKDKTNQSCPPSGMQTFISDNRQSPIYRRRLRAFIPHLH